jgi:hypothetical protein
MASFKGHGFLFYRLTGVSGGSHAGSLEDCPASGPLFPPYRMGGVGGFVPEITARVSDLPVSAGRVPWWAFKTAAWNPFSKCPKVSA